MNVIRTHWESSRRRASREVLAADCPTSDEQGKELEWDVPVQANQEIELADFERQEALRRLRDRIAALKPLDRQVLFLRDVDGCAYDEIAGRLQVPLGTVKSRLARARAHLADVLAEETEVRS